MPFKVFLSYSLDPAEQALAWRLQILAAANGIEMYVPSRGSGPASRTAVAEALNAIARSDCVLAFIARRTDPAVQRELKHAFDTNKRVIPIVREDLANLPLLAQFPKVFYFSLRGYPGNPERNLESEVVEYLRQEKVAKEQRQAIGALVGVGIGLLVLSSLSEK